jgi:flagellar motor switch protein FliG
MAQEADLSNLPEVLREEIEGLTQADRAAVLLLLLGEDEAANILKYMNPAEVQRLGRGDGECCRFIPRSD